VALAASAQNFPAKPITTVVGFEPGGGTDTVARIVARPLGDILGQQVVVENVGAIAVNPHIMKTTYDPRRDLTPITMAVVFANVLVVQPGLPIKTLKDYVEYAKKNPGKV